MKKSRKQAPLLEQLRSVPNVSIACERVGIARNTFYTWLKEDVEFKVAVEEALQRGVNAVSDLAESKLIAHINNGSMRAIEYWLDNHKKEYIKPRDKKFWDRENLPPQPLRVEIVSMRDILGDEVVNELNQDASQSPPNPDSSLHDQPDEPSPQT
jgi:hypothetical protein